VRVAHKDKPGKDTVKSGHVEAKKKSFYAEEGEAGK
jgi:hypothetical protein